MKAVELHDGDGEKSFREMEEAGLERASDIIVDQIRSIDNRRFRDHLGEITDMNKRLLLESLRIVILE